MTALAFDGKWSGLCGVCPCLLSEVYFWSRWDGGGGGGVCLWGCRGPEIGVLQVSGWSEVPFSSARASTQGGRPGRERGWSTHWETLKVVDDAACSGRPSLLGWEPAEEQCWYLAAPVGSWEKSEQVQSIFDPGATFLAIATVPCVKWALEEGGVSGIPQSQSLRGVHWKPSGVDFLMWGQHSSRLDVCTRPFERRGGPSPVLSVPPQRASCGTAVRGVPKGSVRLWRAFR